VRNHHDADASYQCLQDFAISISFGESHLAVLYLTDLIVRSACSELPFPEAFSSKAVNFINTLVCMASSEGGSLHP
jgi:hypothetical protein